MYHIRWNNKLKTLKIWWEDNYEFNFFDDQETLGL